MCSYVHAINIKPSHKRGGRRGGGGGGSMTEIYDHIICYPLKSTCALALALCLRVWKEMLVCDNYIFPFFLRLHVLTCLSSKPPFTRRMESKLNKLPFVERLWAIMRLLL